MHLLTQIETVCSLGGNLDIGSTTTVYFETLPGQTIIGWTTMLIDWDRQPLDCIYRSHYNEWTLPVYTITPIYAI